MYFIMTPAHAIGAQLPDGQWVGRGDSEPIREMYREASATITARNNPDTAHLWKNHLFTYDQIFGGPLRAHQNNSKNNSKGNNSKDNSKGTHVVSVTGRRRIPPARASCAGGPADAPYIPGPTA
jgi:hypothetical protein